MVIAWYQSVKERAGSITKTALEAIKSFNQDCRQLDSNPCRNDNPANTQTDANDRTLRYKAGRRLKNLGYCARRGWGGWLNNRAQRQQALAQKRSEHAEAFVRSIPSSHNHIAPLEGTTPEDPQTIDAVVKVPTTGISLSSHIKRAKHATDTVQDIFEEPVSDAVRYAQPVVIPSEPRKDNAQDYTNDHVKKAFGNKAWEEFEHTAHFDRKQRYAVALETIAKEASDSYKTAHQADGRPVEQRLQTSKNENAKRHYSTKETLARMLKEFVSNKDAINKMYSTTRSKKNFQSFEKFVHYVCNARRSDKIVRNGKITYVTNHGTLHYEAVKELVYRPKQAYAPAKTAEPALVTA